MEEERLVGLIAEGREREQELQAALAGQQAKAQRAAEEAAATVEQLETEHAEAQRAAAEAADNRLLALEVQWAGVVACERATLGVDLSALEGSVLAIDKVARSHYERSLELQALATENLRQADAARSETREVEAEATTTLAVLRSEISYGEADGEMRQQAYEVQVAETRSQKEAAEAMIVEVTLFG